MQGWRMEIPDFGRRNFTPFCRRALRPRSILPTNGANVLIVVVFDPDHFALSPRGAKAFLFAALQRGQNGIDQWLMARRRGYIATHVFRRLSWARLK
jgi:hypothetical protein